MKKGPAAKLRTPEAHLGGFYPMQQESTWVLYDLRDAEAWERAGRECRAWGLSMVEIHELDLDHVLIEFRSGGALELSA